MGIEQKITDLQRTSAEQTAASQALSQEVAGKMGEIDKELAEAITRLDNADVKSLKVSGLKMGVGRVSGSNADKFVHLKTNIKQYRPQMVGLNFAGYHYGLGVIDTDVSFYTYQNKGYADAGKLHSWVVRHKGASLNNDGAVTIDINYYYSQDNNLVLVIYGLNSYSLVTLNSFYPAALDWDIQVDEMTYASSLEPIY